MGRNFFKTFHNIVCLKSNKLQLFYGRAGARKSRVSQKSISKHKAEGKAKGEYQAQVHTIEKQEVLLPVNQRRCKDQLGVKGNKTLSEISRVV